MEEQRFNDVVEAQIDAALAMFREKNDHYSGEQTIDRLAGVKRVAEVRGVSNLEAISGMMAKHTKSVYDMMRAEPLAYPTSVWHEKIGDHINYLLLAIATVYEAHDMTPQIDGMKEGPTDA